MDIKKWFKKGFSLVELMVILAALGGVALVVTRLGKNSMNIQGESQQAAEYADLSRDFHFQLADVESCKQTLQNKTFVAAKPAAISGLEISHPTKKITAGKTGKLAVGAISLTMTNLSEELSKPGTHGVKGEIKISGIASTSAPIKNFPDLRHSVALTVNTDDAGTSTIVSCERFDEEAKEQARVWCGTVTANCLSDGVRVMAIGKYHDGKFSGAIHPLESGSTINCPGLINQDAKLSACGDR